MPSSYCDRELGLLGSGLGVAGGSMGGGNTISSMPFCFCGS